MASEMGIRAYARHRSVTPAAVRKAIKSGRITAVDGKIDPAAADQDWAANTDESKPRNSVSGNPGTRRASPAPLAANGRPTRQALPWKTAQPSTGGYAAARAVRESYEARLKELDYKVRTGELISKDEVSAAVYAMNRRARDLLLAIPDRVSAVLAGISDAAEVHRILTEEFRRVCEELTQPFMDDDTAQPH